MSDHLLSKAKSHKGICAEFESAWKSGSPPSIDNTLAIQCEGKGELLKDLVHMDLEYRLLDGQQVRVEHYLNRYPELKSQSDFVLSLAISEYELRQRLGNTCLTEFLNRFPNLRGELLNMDRFFASQPAMQGTLKQDTRSDHVWYVVDEKIGTTYSFIRRIIQSCLARKIETSLGLLLFVSVTIGVIAYSRQVSLTEREANRADQNLSIAFETLASLQDIEEGNRQDASDSGMVVRELIRRLVPHYSDIVATHSQSRAPSLEIAAAQASLGRCHALLGDYTKAKEHHEEALRLIEELDRPNSVHADSLRNLKLQSLVSLAGLQRREGDSQNSLDAFMSAHKILSSKLEALPTEFQSRDLVVQKGRVSWSISELLQKQKRSEEAIVFAEMAKGIWMSLSTHPKRTENCDFGRELGQASFVLGAAHHVIGDLDVSLQQYREATSSFASLAERSIPTESLYRDLAASIHNCGNVLRDMGQYEEAIFEYRRAVEHRQRLMVMYPNNVSYQSDIDGTRRNLEEVKELLKSQSGGS